MSGDHICSCYGIIMKFFNEYDSSIDYSDQLVWMTNNDIFINKDIDMYHANCILTMNPVDISANNPLLVYAFITMGIPQYAINILEAYLNNTNLLGVIPLYRLITGLVRVLTNTDNLERSLAADPTTTCSHNKQINVSIYLEQRDLPIIISCAIIQEFSPRGPSICDGHDYEPFCDNRLMFPENFDGTMFRQLDEIRDSIRSQEPTYLNTLVRNVCRAILGGGICHDGLELAASITPHYLSKVIWEEITIMAEEMYKNNDYSPNDSTVLDILGHNTEITIVCLKASWDL